MDVGPQLQALADPTRRTIFDLVRHRPSSVRELTDQMPISQPAVSQHLGVLSDARLVHASRRGARHIYRADPEGVGIVRAWADSLWDDALDAFAHAAVAEHDRSRATGDPERRHQRQPRQPTPPHHGAR